MHWYALWVLTMKEEDLGQDLEASISRLGSVKDGKGNLVAREVESWVPSKMKLKWSNRCVLFPGTCIQVPGKHQDTNDIFSDLFAFQCANIDLCKATHGVTLVVFLLWQRGSITSIDIDTSALSPR